MDNTLCPFCNNHVDLADDRISLVLQGLTDWRAPGCRKCGATLIEVASCLDILPLLEKCPHCDSKPIIKREINPHRIAVDFSITCSDSTCQRRS
ncbi:hypothetical protein KAR91_53985 [Candidatus Pacearchaeota archaeon]|nr:hypothetical protein [Candidatus Pacearchaeota archaeon]